MALPRMDRPAIVIGETRWRRQSPTWRRGFREHWTRRGYQVWIQRVLKKNPYWRNSTMNMAQIKFVFPKGRQAIYDVPLQATVQFPQGVYVVQVRYQTDGGWEAWHAPGTEKAWAEPTVEPGKAPKYPKGYRGIRHKTVKAKLDVPKAKKKPKKKRKKKPTKKAKKKPVGRGRPSKKWWKRAMKQIKKYRPEVKNRKKLAGWHWHHGNQKLTRKDIINAGRTVKEWAELYKKYNSKLRKAG